MSAEPARATWQHPVALRYGVALLAVAVAVLVYGLLAPWHDGRQPFLLVAGAVAFAVWFGGSGPALLAAVLGFVVQARWAHQPGWLLGPWDASHAATLALYAVSTGLIILVGHALRRARRDCEAEIAQRRLAQEATLAERRRLEITLKSISDGVLVCDTEGRLEWLNPVAQRLTGWSEDEARGRSVDEVFDAIDEDRGEKVTGRVQRALREGVVIGSPHRTLLRPRTGEPLPIEDSTAPIVGDDGRAIGAVRVFHDARERRRFEATLRQSEATLRAVFDNAPAAIGLVELVDDDILHLQDNPVTCRIFGVEPGGTANRLASELGASPELIALWRTYYLQSAALRQPIAFEYSQELPDQTLRYRATVCCIDHLAAEDERADAPPRRFCYLAEDITQRHGTANRLLESEAQARLALDIAQLGTWSWEVAGDVVHADARTREIAGLPEAQTAPSFRLADVVGRIHEGDWARVEASLSAALRPDSDGRYADEFRFIGGADGAPRWVLAHGQALYDPDDPGKRVSRVLGSLLDIDERKRNEEALADAARHKDEFLATLAHELRNPLAPLRNGVHLLNILIGKDGAAGPAAAAAKPLAIMERQIGHMVRLIDDLLDLARVSGGKLELQRHRIDIADAVREALETSQSLIQDGGHRLSVVLPAQPVFVDADVTRICQVIANLLNNAAKYTPEGGRIRVSAGPSEPGWVDVCVEDDGRGLAPEMLPKIFQMFAQVDRQFGRSSGGLGIGLALARRLVQMHGGELRASSPGLGQGSSFTLRLPRAADGLTASPSPGGAGLQVMTADRQGGLRSACRVLVADDNTDAGDSLINLLSLMGCATRIARDGIEALQLAEAMQPDIALLDIGMPGLDGHQLARRIREQAWGRAIRLVAVTGWGQEADRRASAEAGFDLHWVKPVDPAALDALIESVSAARAEAAPSTQPADALQAPGG